MSETPPLLIYSYISLQSGPPKRNVCWFTTSSNYLDISLVNPSYCSSNPSWLSWRPHIVFNNFMGVSMRMIFGNYERFIMWWLSLSWVEHTRAARGQNAKHPKHNLVGGWATRLKNMKVSWDDDIPNIWKIKFMFQTTICPHLLCGLA